MPFWARSFHNQEMNESEGDLIIKHSKMLLVAITGETNTIYRFIPISMILP